MSSGLSKPSIALEVPRFDVAVSSGMVCERCVSSRAALCVAVLGAQDQGNKKLQAGMQVSLALFLGSSACGSRPIHTAFAFCAMQAKKRLLVQPWGTALCMVPAAFACAPLCLYVGPRSIAMQAKNRLLIREAIEFYDQGLALACGDAQVDAALHNNSAHVHLLLGTGWHAGRGACGVWRGGIGPWLPCGGLCAWQQGQQWCIPAPPDPSAHCWLP